jgi:hypothetical protein
VVKDTRTLHQYGEGSSSTYFQHLQKLLEGSISSITAIDGSSWYTRSELIMVLTAFIKSLNAEKVVTQDFVGDYDIGDHNDHCTATYTTKAAWMSGSNPLSLPSDMPVSDEKGVSQARQHHMATHWAHLICLPLFIPREAAKRMHREPRGIYAFPENKARGGENIKSKCRGVFFQNENRFLWRPKICKL